MPFSLREYLLNFYRSLISLNLILLFYALIKYQIAYSPNYPQYHYFPQIIVKNRV